MRVFGIPSWRRSCGTGRLLRCAEVRTVDKEDRPAARSGTRRSGREVSPSAPLLDRERGTKITLSGPGTFSRVAVLDPDLLASLPRGQAALSGVDALTHGIEAYLTNLTTPITDALAIAAV